MESIDVHDLPEEEAQLIAAFVALLRRRRRAQQPVDEEAPRVGVWDLGVKGPLTRREIYDHL